MSRSALSLAHWTTPAIDQECRAQYSLYEAALIRHYTRYFASRPNQSSLRQAYSARYLESALPPGWGHLWQLVPQDLIHTHARSGRSSQAVALGIFGAALRASSNREWFWRAIGLPHLASSARDEQRFEFEHALRPSDLNEHPRVTKLDLAVSNRKAFAAVETKWSEPGLGICSCIRDGDGNPASGFTCAKRVCSRTAYWEIAEEVFTISAARSPDVGCRVSAAYQAIRNFAAARQLAQERTPVFVLVFDERNPYFTETGFWPGWPRLIKSAVRRSGTKVIFRAVSWQNLIRRLPLPKVVRLWASEKHLLR